MSINFEAKKERFHKERIAAFRSDGLDPKRWLRRDRIVRFIREWKRPAPDGDEFYAAMHVARACMHDATDEDRQASHLYLTERCGYLSISDAYQSLRSPTLPLIRDVDLDPMTADAEGRDRCPTGNSN